MSAGPTPAAGLRIGEVARLVGTTTRTIRYYEEIGLLTGGGDREAGRHRVYADADVERLREALRLKALLGVTLEELKELLEVEASRGALREEWHHGSPGKRRRREILDTALGHIERQRALLAGRRAEIAKLERELKDRERRLRARRAEED